MTVYTSILLADSRQGWSPCLLRNTGIGEFLLLNAPTIITAPFVALNPLQTPVSISVSLCIHPSHTEESAVPVGQLFIFLHTNTGGKCLPSCQQVNRNPHPPSGRGEACSTLPAQVRAAVMIQLQDVMFYKQFHHMHMNAFYIHIQRVVAMSYQLFAFFFLFVYLQMHCVLLGNAPGPLLSRSLEQSER